jgi:hypothetical protein
MSSTMAAGVAASVEVMMEEEEEISSQDVPI